MIRVPRNIPSLAPKKAPLACRPASTAAETLRKRQRRPTPSGSLPWEAQEKGLTDNSESDAFDEAAWICSRHGSKTIMIALQRVSGKFGARSPWLRTPRSRPQHSERRTNSTSSKDQINVNTQTRNQVPSHPPNEVSVQATKTEPVDIPLQLWYHRLGPVSDFFNWFHRAQLKRPYTVQVGTTLTTYLCGDLLAQDIGGEPYDPIRTLRMLTIGALASIPGYKWYVSRPGDLRKGGCSHKRRRRSVGD